MGRRQLLKLIFQPEPPQLLGVQIIGEGASKLVHIGHAALSFTGPIDYFVNTAFHGLTLAECHKMAGIEGLIRLTGGSRQAAQSG